MIVPGANAITSSGSARRFLLVLPAGFDPATERLPVIVMWHWLRAEAGSFLSHGVQEAADSLRFIAIIPESKGDLEINLGFAQFDPGWPYLNTSTDTRMEEEARFFDDMITCVAAQYPINESCISTAGVSAGALWSSQLAQLRSDRLASAIILSGGTGPATGFDFFDVQPFRTAPRPVPMLIAWGGPMDQCGLNFNTASHNLESNLATNGNFVLECVHNCGHVEPPVNLEIIWRFATDHPYWLRAGESPYLARGLPEGAPSWCAIGAGNATPRSEACPPAEGCPVPALPGL